MQDLCDASPLGFAFFKQNADLLGLTFFQRYTSLRVPIVNTICAGLTLDSVGAVGLGEFPFNFGLDASLMSSGYESGCTYGPLRLGKNP